MTTHFFREIDRIKNQLLELAGWVEENLNLAVQAVEQDDEAAARKVIDGDVRIDEKEIDVEEESLKILTLHQPVAADLRFLIAVLKINNELERVGDLAVNIAERAVFLSTQPKPDMPFDFASMADVVKRMLRRSLDALVELDEAAAREVLTQDDEVDAMNR
ncbi:MAG: phosphate signaling complex protein PhoU, partial [Phycisphaerae bacterium]|nr:phosphate signaling complex protein PhoU [Phycisphaerae bacterium]